MSFLKLSKLSCRLRQLKEQSVQPCPPDLVACEACGRLECALPKWIQCERRLVAARYLQTGDKRALERLRVLRQPRSAA